MIFDVYYPFYSKKAGRLVPGVKPCPMDWAKIKHDILSSKEVSDKIDAHRTGDKNAKVSLPAICFVGRCQSTRKASAMIPTQLVMVDIDHCTDPLSAWSLMKDVKGHEWNCDNILLVHVTPSRGLHLFFKSQEGMKSLRENMDYYNEIFDFGLYGDYDTVVHDFSRVSFAFKSDELLFENAMLLLDNPPLEENLTNLMVDTEQGSNSMFPELDPKKASDSNDDIPTFTEEEVKAIREDTFKGSKLTTIIDEWVKFRGAPGNNEVHNFYNEMVKYFRNIMGNNKRKLFLLLPKFGHSDAECWSQIKSITRSNTLSRLDREFYFFLLDKGFITRKGDENITEYLLSEDTKPYSNMPTPPPVIREFVRIAPDDFKIPVINALLPILGTLSSYVGAVYPWDDRVHTTSFFSVVYAPPSYGKGFVGRLMFLFDDLRLRDYVQAARENIFMRAVNRKSDNEKSPENPRTSLRIIPPKNSEAEFLEKQRDNHGFHMFTYAEEMDSWAKGEKAAGGNKSDMIRIAWDNGLYGQQFKSVSTFKGTVQLYWNVLITGTLNQIENYFRNVENGLASRCSFCEIENQEYQIVNPWKKLTAKAEATIRAYMKRCDENTYEEPCLLTIPEIDAVSDEDFDKEIDWRFKFKERKIIDIDWIMPVIKQFEEEQCKKAALALDPARDSFRRRVGVRGFRLALLCTTLYPTLNQRAIGTICEFVKWWMEVDLENILKLLGEKYNEQTKKIIGFRNQDVFQELADEFDKNDVLAILKRQGKKSKVADVLYRWVKLGAVVKIEKNVYKKKK